MKLKEEEYKLNHFKQQVETLNREIDEVKGTLESIDIGKLVDGVEQKINEVMKKVVMVKV